MHVDAAGSPSGNLRVAALAVIHEHLSGAEGAVQGALLVPPSLNRVLQAQVARRTQGMQGCTPGAVLAGRHGTQWLQSSTSFSRQNSHGGSHEPANTMSML